MLDVSALLPLADTNHAHHERASEWFAQHGAGGWASCAITENGMARIFSQPSYPGFVPTQQAIEWLMRACRSRDHEYWPCDVTIRDAGAIDRSRILGPKQLTDIYLLALAVAHGGRFVTFDNGIALSAVPGATEENLVMLANQ